MPVRLLRKLLNNTPHPDFDRDCRECCRRYVCEKVAKRTLAWQRYALRIQKHRLKHTRKINAVTYFYVALIESHAYSVVDYP